MGVNSSTPLFYNCSSFQPIVVNNYKCPEIKDMEFVPYDIASFNKIRHDGCNYYFDKEKIFKENIEITEIAEGGFGAIEEVVVTRGKDKIVFIQKKIFSDENFDEDYFNEIEFLDNNLNEIVDCGGVVRAKVSQKFENAPSGCLVERMILMPKMNGDLTTILEEHPNLTELQKCSVLMFVGNNVDCIRKQGFEYFDIKPANILWVCSNQRIELFLGDLGSMEPMKNKSPPNYVISYPPIIDSEKDIEQENSGEFELPNNESDILKIYTYLLLVLYIKISFSQYRRYKDILQSMTLSMSPKYKDPQRFANEYHKVKNDISIPKIIDNNLVRYFKYKSIRFLDEYPVFLCKLQKEITASSGLKRKKKKRRSRKKKI